MAINGKKIGLFLGIIFFFTILAFSPPEGLSKEAWAVLAITALMATWWITEAIPLAATALIPIVLYPAFGVMTSTQATASYADQVIFLFMGGFFLAVTMEKWNLHRRVALLTIKLVGTSPSHMILGFMIATAFLSMWISNTATAVMMVPIGIAVTSQITGHNKEEILHGSGEESNFAKSLMLGIAYAASIGGVATIIGTPPNTIMVGMLDRLYGLKISFAQWMLFGVPLAVIMLAITWLILTKLLFRTGSLKLAGSKEIIRDELKKLGKMTRAEKSIAIIGLLMAFSWIFRGFINLPAMKLITDSTIAIAGALLLFLTPVNFKKGEFLLDWQTAVKIPWGIILLFGGGITLANGFSKTGLATWISTQLTSLSGVSTFVFIAIVVTLTLFLTEVTSNTATATLLVPIMGSAAIAMNVHPFATIVSACVAASFAFMLPVATPPNAVIFGSGYVRIKDMAYAGLLLNLVGIALISVFTMYVIPIIWGVDLSVLPQSVLDMVNNPAK